MPDVELNQFTVIQLKNWLGALGRQTSGTKAELIARLQDMAPEDRGDPPAKTTSHQGEPPQASVSAAEPLRETDGAASLSLQQQQGEILFKMAPMTSQPVDNFGIEQLSLVDAEKDTLLKLRDEIDASMAVLHRIRTEIDDANKNKTNHICQNRDVISNSIENTGNVNSSANSDAVKVNSTNVTITNDDIGIGKSSVGKETDNSGNQLHNANVNKLLESPAASLALAKEVTMEYDGSLCARNWVTQLHNIAQVYNLDAGCMRMLLIAKLKGNAQRWLHANATRILEPASRLCEQLILAFGTKMSKGELRSAFQKRQWRPEEKFAAYFEDKIMLANDINIDVEELLENIIEGIPAAGLRDQARIQCFSEPEQMLKAFAGVRLPERKREGYSSKDFSGGVAANKNLRCANCNSKGHFAKECLKPKREPGSCYACGTFGHFVAQCPERKSTNTNNYHAS